MKDTTSQHVELTRSIDRWLEQIDVGDPEAAAELSIDLADILRAAADVRSLLTELLATELSTPSQADKALQLAANIEVQLFTELKGHLESLEQAWPHVLERLDSLGT